ncbi:small acid-soluble spore protein SspI [Mangrovibacillus cuniculi]|uniref:Small, acid-soluble spore protein I n=1 Tax=Mangrovibacillus cuniculi TaxID=2593652 RepID=A0A7S8CBZ6_9BACI|nr:small acid-soluble spore protein SspI [Mangrovibacillus cuniculi]QPC47176.1 small acid-soluble spore protein SspI [Mangrovibacillus cuniculi]
MNLNLRQAILNNISGNNESQLQETIVDAIQSGEEKMLPGLGVLFEIFWNSAPQDEKTAVLETIADQVK